MDIAKHIVGFACLAFSIVGFVEVGIGFKVNMSYNLLKTLIYCLLFGIAMGLI